MMINYIYKIMGIFIILLYIISFVSASSAALTWSKSLGSQVNYISTNQGGTFVVAGLSNGTVVSYDTNGNLLWSDTYFNGSIIKVLTIGDGSKVLAMNDQNQVYYISGSTGILLASVIGNTVNNITDIGISHDGNHWAVSGNKSLTIYNFDGSVFVTNQTFQDSRME